MSTANRGRRVPDHGSGGGSLPSAPNRGEGTVLFVGGVAKIREANYRPSERNELPDSPLTKGRSA